MWNAAPPLTMTDEQRRTIEAWHRASNTPQGIALRAKIALLAADGAANNRIAMELGTTRTTVILWRRRFQEGGVDALTDIQPGRGRRPLYGPERIADIVKVTTQTKPQGATHWSTRSMAKAQGIARPPSSGFGTLMDFSPTGRGDLSSPRTGTSPRSLPMLWGCT